MTSSLNGGKILDAQGGLVICEPKRGKVAIVGGAWPTRYRAPLDDSTWEVWSMNSVRHYALDGLRADRCWEMHPLSIQDEHDWAFLCDPPAPVYMFDVYPEVPMSVRFPMERVEDILGVSGGKPGDFFACSMCYQVALAIIEGFTTIGLFGIELDRGSARERTLERASLAWWCGYAQGKGIEIVMPFWSMLLAHPLRYGYDYPGEMDWGKRWVAELGEQIRWEETQ